MTLFITKRYIVEGDGLFNNFKRDANKGFSPHDRRLIEKHKDDKIYKITLFRYPVQSAIQNLMHLYTMGRLRRGMKELNYDTLFHLGMIVNDDYILEKQSSVMFYKRQNFLKEIKSKNPDTMEVNINKEITIGELINKTRELMGDNKFSYYNAVRNNCQVFIFSILKANNLLNNENANFVKQDTKTLLQKEKTLQFLGKTATDLGAIMDRVIDGNGL